MIDIKFYHSGGVLNSDPALDLGSNVSVFEVGDTLFNTLTPEESRNGMTDYRCFYVYNTSSDVGRDVKIWLSSQIPGGSYIDLGLDLENEIQTIEFSGTPHENDTAIFQLNGTNFTTTYSPNLTFWKKSFQEAVRTIDNFQDTIIEVSGEVPLVTFTVKFLGQAQNKNFPIISLITNNLFNTSVSILETQAGSPINTVAPTIPTKLHIPPGVVFGVPTINLGDLNQNDGFPVWVRRITPPNTVRKVNDNFKIKLKISST